MKHLDLEVLESKQRLFKFASCIGAMENWGLITFEETCLLVDDLKTSTANKQRVAIVIAHELAHQWYGISHSVSFKRRRHTLKNIK